MMPISTQSSLLTQSLYHEQAHRHVETSVSTNSELAELITSNILSANHVHVLTADTQSSGRGQSGRCWQSPKGNVYLSLYYPKQHTRLPLNQPISGLLSLCIGYYLAKLPIIEQINQQRLLHNQPIIGVKWANDIGFYQPQADKNGRHQFQKLSGILIEPLIDKGQMLGIIVGVGVNVNVAPTLTNQTQEGFNYQSVCLADFIDTDNDPKSEAENLYKPISNAIFQAILTHQEISKNDNDMLDFIAKFSEIDVLKQRRLSVFQDNQQQAHQPQDHQPTVGKSIGVNKFGCLQLQDDNGKVCTLFTGKIDVIK